MMAAMPPCNGFLRSKQWWDLWRAVVEHESHGDWTAWKKDEDARDVRRSLRFFSIHVP